ncbi:MAG: ribose 5-phosphate isomerase B [Bacillota bacterium]|nr:ribose 5-phosphate isomerase B [Bacillota bacterium]
MRLRLAIAADHFGLPLKEALVEHIKQHHPEVELSDLGVHTPAPVDYPDVALPLAEAVAAGQYERGVLVCGTGAGMAICANKVPGVRAVCCHDPYTAERARKSNNAQILTMGSLVVGVETAKMLLDIWLSAEFAGGRSLPKVAKIDAIDAKYHRDGTRTGVRMARRPV